MGDEAIKRSSAVRPTAQATPPSTPAAAPLSSHPACAAVTKDDPADQCLHNIIAWQNRYEAKIWGGYSPAQRAFVGGLAYQPSMAHFGVRLEGSYSPELKWGGGRASSSLTLPINEKMSLRFPLSVGFAVDQSQSDRTWFTLEGSAGAHLRWQPNRYLRLSFGGDFAARYRWSPDADAWREDLAMAKEAQKNLVDLIERRLSQFSRDVQAQLSGMSESQRAAFETVMAAYLSALRTNAGALALAALTPSPRDDAAAAAALDAAGDAALARMDSGLQADMAAFKSFLGSRVLTLIAEIKSDVGKSWDDYKQGFRRPFDDGGGGNLTFGVRADLMFPLVQSASKKGGGIWTLAGLGVQANIPVALAANDKRLLPLDQDVTRPGVRFSPYLGLRFQLPGQTMGMDLTGEWNADLTFGGPDGTRFDGKNVTAVVAPFIHF